MSRIDHDHGEYSAMAAAPPDGRQPTDALVTERGASDAQGPDLGRERDLQPGSWQCGAMGPTSVSQSGVITPRFWTVSFTLPERLPPLRLLLVWDNLAGHKSTEMVVWLCQHGIMPLYTPLGGSWLNMAESIQRILKRRALAGQHPQSPAEIGTWFEQTARAWNRQPTPFVWHGKRRQRRRKRRGDT